MEMNRKDLTPELLRELLEYDPETGRLTWRNRAARHFTGGSNYRSPESRANNWNTKWAGKEAFTTVSPYGYNCGAVLEVSVVAHRVAWAIHYGRWPSRQIDHINGDKTDNRIANLRDISQQENKRNQPRRSTNKSGVTGVFWTERSKKWRAYISVKSRLTHIGYFDDFDDAVAARREAEKQYDYHPNHGREQSASAA